MTWLIDPYTDDKEPTCENCGSNHVDPYGIEPCGWCGAKSCDECGEMVLRDSKHLCPMETTT